MKRHSEALNVVSNNSRLPFTFLSCFSAVAALSSLTMSNNMNKRFPRSTKFPLASIRRHKVLRCNRQFGTNLFVFLFEIFIVIASFCCLKSVCEKLCCITSPHKSRENVFHPLRVEEVHKIASFGIDFCVEHAPKVRARIDPHIVRRIIVTSLTLEIAPTIAALRRIKFLRS